MLRKDSDIVAAQCKALKKKVGVAVGRELAAAAKDFGANRAMIICTNGASPQLMAYAETHGIEIVTTEDLVKLQLSLERCPPTVLEVRRTREIPC